MSNRLKLPFLVSPYPDEILGSWLYRLQIHNHASLLQEVSGIAKKSRLKNTEWRDITKPSPEFHSLIDVLGSTYNSVIMELTTYSYWLRFHSSKEFYWKSETSELPSLILKGRQQTILRLRGILPNLLRVCPICLDEDAQQFGETYLHRAHHLPYVRVCYKHDTSLISRCPACNQIFRMESTFIHARINCTCKFDLRKAQISKPSPSSAWENLARYSAEVLFSTENFQKYDIFFDFLDSRLARNEITKRPDILAHLSKIYGTDAAKAMLCLSRQGSDIFTYSPIGWVSKRDLRAPQICALMASLDSSFTHTHSLLVSHKFEKEISIRDVSPLSFHKEIRGPKIPRSVTEARVYACELAQSTKNGNSVRSLLYWRYKKLFWYLVIFDREWFDSQFPSGKRGAPHVLPTIQTDRIKILTAICKASRPSVRIWANLAQQAFFRASLRDALWLENRKNESIQRAKKEKFEQRQENIKIYKDEILRAIASMPTTNSEEVILSPAKISPYATLSGSQIKYIFYRNPGTRKSIIDNP